MFIRKYWIPLLVFSIAIVGVGLYLLAIQPAPEPIVIIKPVEPIEESTAEKSTVKTETSSDTSQDGHFHTEGTWHAEPHDALVEASEAEVSEDALATPVVTERAASQIDEATLESASRKLKDPDVYNAWIKWSEKARELRRKHIQAAGEGVALLPTTEEEFERIKNDPEWHRRRNEALRKTAKIYRMMKAHEEKNPLLQ